MFTPGSIKVSLTRVCIYNGVHNSVIDRLTGMSAFMTKTQGLTDISCKKLILIAGKDNENKIDMNYSWKSPVATNSKWIYVFVYCQAKCKYKKGALIPFYKIIWIILNILQLAEAVSTVSGSELWV